MAYLAEAPKSTRTYTAYKRAEALAQEAPLPGVPLQIRNAPTKLMKKLGYGKEYSYDPDFAHPVINVSEGLVVIVTHALTLQEYLPFSLAEHSTHARDPTKHILRPHDVEMSLKKWDEDRLADWERKVQGGRDWEGRARMPEQAKPNTASTNGPNTREHLG